MSPSAPARFATTHWSVIVAAQDGASPQAQEALSSLCAAYWYPLYVFIRRQGYAAEQAQDLTQEFFARLLERDFLGSVDPAKGRFRAFLLAACKHFLANERDRERAQKRGGGMTILPLDWDRAEGRYSLEPAHVQTPEKLFERRWALTLLDSVLARLREEFAGKGKAEVFESLRVFLLGEGRSVPYTQIADELGMSLSAVKVAVHRLRQRYRELLRDEIAKTVVDVEQIDDEIRALFAAFSS